jgi:hypothetical protein
MNKPLSPALRAWGESLLRHDLELGRLGQADVERLGDEGPRRALQRRGLAGQLRPRVLRADRIADE